MRNFKKIAVFNFSYKIFGALIGLLTTVILTKVLEKDDFGLYSLALTSSLLLVAVLQFGTPLFLAREVAKKKSDYKEIKKIKGRVFIFVTVSFVFVTPLLFYTLHFILGFDALVVTLIMLLASIVYPNNLNAAVFRGLGKPTISLTSETILRQLFALILISGFSYFHEIDIYMALFCYFFGALLSYVLFGSYLAFVVRASWVQNLSTIKSREKLNFLRPVFMGAYPFFFISSFPIINGNIEIFMIGGLGTLSDVASFKVATNMTSIISFGLVAVAQLSIPVFSNFHDSHDARLKALNQYKQSTQVTLFLAISFIVIFMILGVWFIDTVFGESYKSVYWLVVIMSVGHLVSCYVGPAGLFLNMTNHEAAVFRMAIIALVANVIMNFFWIPVWGAYGAAISSAISLSIWNITLKMKMKNVLCTH